MVFRHVPAASDRSRMGHVDLQPAFSGLLRTCDVPLPEGSEAPRLSWALLPVQRHQLASTVNLSLPHSAPSPLELSQLLRGLLLASFRDPISCRGHSSGFRLQSFPHTDSRDHFWPDTLLTSRARMNLDDPFGQSQHLTVPFDSRNQGWRTTQRVRLASQLTIACR